MMVPDDPLVKPARVTFLGPRYGTAKQQGYLV
jgi:hypothetical protein